MKGQERVGICRIVQETSLAGVLGRALGRVTLILDGFWLFEVGSLGRCLFDGRMTCITPISAAASALALRLGRHSELV